MNKIFKTKYDVTTGQTKVVSELATNKSKTSSCVRSISVQQPHWGDFIRNALSLAVALAFSSSAFAHNDLVSYGGSIGTKQSDMEYCYAQGQRVYCDRVALNPNNHDHGKVNLSKVGILGVAIGHGAWASGSGSTGVGANAHAIGGQSVVVGNNSAAEDQSVALGSDVFAIGKSSIAIGNDDIADNRFNDRLPKETIEKFFNNLGSTTNYFKDGWDYFSKKYIQDGHTDNRHYSPTYAKGVGSIAIGSRNIAGGDLSTSLGALSFALANRATAIGVRAFVSQDADGGVAIGDSSRVFATNSFAIGNESESTNKGALSYGSGAKAVGTGSVAIGTKVASNAKINEASARRFRDKLMSNLGIGTIEENEKTEFHTRFTSAEVKDLKTGSDNNLVQAGFSAHLDDSKVSSIIDKVVDNLELTYEEERKEFLSIGDGRNQKSVKKKEREGNHAITVGYYTANSGDNTVAIGTASYVKGQNSVVLGALNNVGKYASNAVAIGVGTNVHKENSIALGTGTTVTGAGVVAIGSGVGVTKDNTIAVGYGVVGESSESIILGNEAKIKKSSKRSIVIGNSAKVENKNITTTLTEPEMSAIAIGTSSSVYAVKGVALGDNASIGKDAHSSMALGNETKADMMNSVALGYRSTTIYFYDKNDANKSTAVLSGKDSLSAMELDGYVPEGSSYKIFNDKAAGIISVGGWDNGSASRATGDAKKSAVGLRRIVNVAPGALDSDVATVGQLKALNYVKKEGLVVYYTEEDGKPVKLVKKEGSNEFYKVDTKTGEPLKDSQPVDKSKVLVGAKGANEVIGSQDLGEKIRFGHLEKGEITATSDQAITGNQLHQLGSSILGLTVNNSDKTKFDTVQFEAVNVTDPKDTSGVTTNFKDALTKAIGAINKGYKFNADQVKANANTTPFYLGATIEIKAGDVTKKSGATTEKYLGKNLKTEFKNDSSKATFTIGLKDDPEFNTVKLTGNPTDGQHAVNKAYVDEALQNVSRNLHYLSVKGTDSEKGAGSNYTNDGAKGTDSEEGAGSNYTNDGAKGTHSVAIGVKASATTNATSGIAIGYNAKSDAENAVVIGRDVSIDVKNSFVLGSNNTVTQGFKETNGAVVVIGSGTKLVESKSSIAIGAVFVERGGKKDGTVIENAAWTASIGNKNKIKNGTDIVALGNNIKALDETNEAENGTKNANTELILIGNASKATSAKESVIIGAKAEAELKAKQAVIIGHSAKAEASAVGAVVIGQGATVKTAAGDSIALGQGSEATTKEKATEEATVDIDSKNIKFKWTAGVSSSDRDKKSVLSIGKTGKERQIKHVAAGAVTATSTDAINGSQLYAVADEFSKLAVNVLGAEVDTAKTGFKKSKFEVAKYSGNTSATTPAEMTFKEAIAQNTTAINKGFIFGVGDQNDEQGTHYLGDKLIIKAGAIDTPSTITAGEKYLPDNIKTAYLSSKQEIVIGIKESPTFKNVLITGEIPEDTSADPKKNTYDNYAVNKKYLDKRLEKVAANFTVKGDNSKAGEGYTLDKDHNELNINGDSENITTEVSDKGIKISLKKELTGITSIANNDTKIELKNGTTKSIVFKTGTSGNDVTLTGNKFSGVSEISGKNSKSKLTLGADKATVELENGKSKLELKDNEATITAGTDAGSIKINNNGNKKIELSPESGATLTLEKDSTTNSGSKYVKATGLSTVGLSDDNALIFKNNGSKSAELNVGTNTTYKFTETGLDLAGKPITNLGSGLDQNGSGGTNVRQGLDELLKLIDSTQTGTQNQNSDKLNKAINAGDLLHVAQGLVNKGLTFKGDTGKEFTRQLGATVTIKGDGMDLTSKAENDAITFTLNKATSVDKDDEKVVTSKAVATELEKYTKTTDLVDKLGTAYLKVDGSNIGEASNKKTFGGNVGIAEIKLDGEKSSTELVQADAVIKYLKGTGPDSVKISDSTKTMAKGNYSISIGHEAVSENAESIAIGYMTHAQNKKSIALGNESEVLGEKSIAIGTENKIDGEGKYSTVLGIENKVSSKFTYLIGYNNDIKGDNTFVLGSNILTDNSIKNAVILGDRSKAEANAVSVGSDTQQRRIVYVATPTDKYDAVNKQYVDGLGLNFKGNDDKNIHKKLSETLEIVGKGLNKNQTAKFKGTDGNIAVINNKQNKLEISLNRDLKGIKSISDSKNKNIATEIRFNSKNSTSSISNSLITNLTISSNGGTFEFNRTGLHINNKQITGLRSGLLENHKGEDSDRKDLDYLIGGSFNASSIKTHAVNVGDLAKISKEIVEKGYKYNADIPSNNSNDTSIKLGSTISIVKWTDTPASGTGQPAVTVGTGIISQTSAVKYTGDNLTTRYTYDGGNAKIEIGFNESPTFKAVMLAENQTYNGGNAVDGKELITKGYLEQALDKFKFKVENGSGKPIEIGRGDTLKFNAGFNIQLTLAKEGEKPANGATSASSTSAVTSTPAPTPTAPVVASNADSSAPASTPSGGANGDGASPSNDVSTNGGSPDGASMPPTTTTTSTTTTTTGNTSTPTTTKTVELTIGTTEELKDITSISSKTAGENGAGSTGEVTKLTLDADKGATFKVGNQGAEVNINKEGLALKDKDGTATVATLNKDGLTVGNKEAANGDKTHTVYGKNGLTVKGKDGSKEVVSLKVADGENSQGNNGGNGQSATLAFAKIGNGSGAGTGADAKGTGTGKITGLADIKPDEKDGTLAANKNYVDEKVSDLNNNRPFDFYLNGEKVVKDKDGNFKKLKDGKPDQALTEEEKKQVVIKAEPSTAPIGISNVASGLGITTPTKDEKKQLSELAEKVNEKVEALGEKAKTLSDTATKLADLELMVSSLKQTVDTMPDGEAKDKINENLKKYQEQLSAAQEAKKNAKEAVESARNELIEANGDYNALSEAIAKVEELVEPDSEANLSNVATVGDLQAVARAGLNFVGNDDVTVHKNVGETLSITGEGTFNSDRTASDNIKVEMSQDGKGLEVKLSDQLKNMTSFETREVNGKKARLDSNGLSVENTSTKERSHLSENRLAFYDEKGLGLNLDGKDRALKVGEKAIISINGKNEALVEDLNASSSGQAIANKNYVDAKNNELRTQLHSVNRESRSGIAGANAAAALPMIAMPGKSALAVSAGAYKGQSAVALGYSRMSDNGKIMLKLHGNSTSTGDFGGGVGIGWAW
ncbi:YadA-like family protein [Histophilus somni]|uniref:YadA-like family protein n=1 Tax=Histophilus somni TaxID=731 RepID=UPI00201ED88D|nr:YadA-like family protein [Histophilus somni]